MRTKLLSVLCVLCLALGLCACSGGGGTTDTTAKADMEDLQAALLAADPSLPEMLSVTGDVEDAARLFTYVSDFPYEKVENFLLSYSATGKADEIAVIAVKDKADVDAAAQTLRAHLEDRLKLFRQYEPEEVARAEQGQVFTSGPYAVLIICDDGAAVKTAFEDYLAALS